MLNLDRKPENPEAPTYIHTLARRLDALEARLAPSTRTPRGPQFTDGKLARVAQAIYCARARRAKYFGSRFLVEPAWDMLLDLFINHVRGLRVSTTSLCIAARVPPTTGLRWLTTLVDEGWVSRDRDRSDARVFLVDLTPMGLELMRDYLAEGVLLTDLPIGD